MRRIVVAAAVLFITALPASAQIPVVLNQPVTPAQAIEIAERLGQIEFGIKRCGFKPNRAKVDVLVKKQMEGGAGGNMLLAMDALQRRATTYGIETVCSGIIGMFGPNGSIVPDVITK